MRSPLLLAALLGGTTLPGLAWAEVPKVVTDLPAVQSLALQVMGDLGPVEVLLEQGANAHSYQMKPSQARALEQADLVLWVGAEMTPWLDRAITSVAPDAHVLSLLHAEGTHRQDFAAPHDHEDEHGADEHAADAHDHAAEGADAHGDEDEDGHVHAGLDPHAWLDPANAELWLGLIADEFSRLDPEHAATYAANAAAAKAKIAALDATLTAELAPVKDRPFVVFHAAYGYFADHYGLKVAGAIALGDATDPGAAHLAELRADLTADGVVCAFPEAQHDTRPAERLIEGTGVKLGGALDPSGSTLSYGADLYERLMQGLADTISGCLAG